VVRRLVGYGRLEGVAAGEALARLDSASRLFVNFFQPSFKLAEKERVGAHVRKRYYAPETPCARLLASTAIAESMKDRLRAVLGTLDPLRLLDEIRTVQHHLAGLAAGDHVHVLPHRDADLDRSLKSLAHAWRDGEVRPTHRKGPKPPRHWRTRKDPFEATWPRVVTWLESELNRTAKELFTRLHSECLRNHWPTLVMTWRRDGPIVTLASGSISGRSSARRETSQAPPRPERGVNLSLPRLAVRSQGPNVLSRGTNFMRQSGNIQRLAVKPAGSRL
jgi:hypothetical protein